MTLRSESAEQARKLVAAVEHRDKARVAAAVAIRALAAADVTTRFARRTLASVLTQRRRKTWRIVRRIQTKCFALNNQKVNKALLPAKRISHLALKKSSVIVQYTTAKNQNLVTVITETFRAVYVGEKSVAVLCE